jgi:hypothetical protein
MKVEFYINGIEVNQPNNLDEFKISRTYDKDGNIVTTTTNNFIWGVNDRRRANDAIPIIEKHIQDGKNGGVGVTEGLPLEIYLNNEKGKRYRVFNGYLDIWGANISKYEIQCAAEEQGQIDWLNKALNTESYEYMYDQRYFGSDYFIEVPYCINKKQNNLEVIISLLGVFVVVQECIDAVNQIKYSIITIANGFSSISEIFVLIGKVVYLAILIITLYKLMNDLYYLIVQPVKYHNAMFIKDLVEIALSRYDMKLSSSILQGTPFKYMALLPEKYNINEINTGLAARVVGSLKPNRNEKVGFYKGYPGELISSLREMFNARIIINDGTLYFEKQDFSITSAKYQVPEVVNEFYRFNKDEFKSNYKISFALDTGDRNTIQEYLGTSYQVTQSQISINNKRMVMLKDYEPINIPFALAKRKKELNAMEEILDAMFEAIAVTINLAVTIVNGAISAVNAIIKFIKRILKALSKIGIDIPFKAKPLNKLEKSNLGSLIDSRVGIMVMEQDYVAIPKIMLIDRTSNPRNNKLLSFADSFLNAKYLYDEYHFFNNFVTTKGVNSQGIIKTVDSVNFSFDDDEKTRSSGNILDSDGKDATLMTLDYYPIAEIASYQYKRKEIYTNNLQINTQYPNE